MYIQNTLENTELVLRGQLRLLRLMNTRGRGKELDIIRVEKNIKQLNKIIIAFNCDLIPQSKTYKSIWTQRKPMAH